MKEVEALNLCGPPLYNRWTIYVNFKATVLSQFYLASYIASQHMYINYNSVQIYRIVQKFDVEKL